MVHIFLYFSHFFPLSDSDLTSCPGKFWIQFFGKICQNHNCCSPPICLTSCYQFNLSCSDFAYVKTEAPPTMRNNHLFCIKTEKREKFRKFDLSVLQREISLGFLDISRDFTKNSWFLLNLMASSLQTLERRVSWLVFWSQNLLIWYSREMGTSYATWHWPELENIDDQFFQDTAF